MSRFDNKPQNTVLKTWAKNLGLADFFFHKKKYGVKFFFESDKTIKVAKNV